MKESSIGSWRKELLLPWQSKSNPTRGGARRLPTTLNSMQIILLCGFASIVLLWNGIASGSYSWSSSPTPEVDTIPHSLVSFSAPKRNIAQIREQQVQEQELQEHLTHDLLHTDKPILKPVEKDSLGRKIWEAKGVEGKIALKEEPVNVDLIDHNGAELKDSEVPIDDPETKKKSPEKSKLQQEQNENYKSSQQQQRKLENEAEDMWMPTWMPSGFRPKRLGLNPKNWDEQRAAWLEKHPEKRLNSDGKPRMLLVSGSSPWPCRNPVGDHYILKFIKNKIDYCRQHNIEIFYNLAHLDREMSSYWAKLPILRKLMLNHPEIEWFFWMDADAVFTDMVFKIPMDDYKNYNLVMWGYEAGFYGEKSWVAINNGVFFLRNCQWSLDLIDMWAPMGPEGTIRDKAGELLTSFMTQRPKMEADDQSALGYLILTKEELRPKVKLVWEYELSGYWADHVTHYEEFMTKDHPGLGDKRWPFTTHFTGCQPCGGVPNPAYDKLNCVKQMERAFNFADNQVLQMLGFMHESLDSVHLKRIKEDGDHQLDTVGPNTWTTATKSYGL